MPTDCYFLLVLGTVWLARLESFRVLVLNSESQVSGVEANEFTQTRRALDQSKTESSNPVTAKNDNTARKRAFKNESEENT